MTELTNEQITKMALACGAAKFYPQAQLTASGGEDNYLVSARFLQRFARAVAVHAVHEARWPATPAEVREWVGSNFNSVHFAHVNQQPSANDTYSMSAHDILSAFSEWVHNQTEQEGTA